MKNNKYSFKESKRVSKANGFIGYKNNKFFMSKYLYPIKLSIRKELHPITKRQRYLITDV